MDVAVELEQVSFAFRAARPVLEGIDLRVPRGSVLGVIGPNGGGKTTLLRLLVGLLRPTSGAIRIEGLSPVDAVRRGGIVGYLPQTPAVAERLPIHTRQLVQSGLAGRLGLLHGADADDLLFVDALIDNVGLTAARHTPLSDLSGGQLQRALIARALAGRPRLLLLDEPIVGIDRRGQQEFIELIQKLRASLGLTVIFVSHDLRAVTSISDRIACVAGRVHFHDVPQQMPAELVYRMFACDLATIGLAEGGALPRCDDPGCDGHHHASPDATRVDLKAGAR